MKKNYTLIRNRLWIYLLLLLFFPIKSEAQSIIRQNIGCMGHSTITDNIMFQQTIGQPFFTAGHYEARLGYRPGFIQNHHIEPNLIMPDYENKIRLYPNPASSFIVIESQELITEAIIKVTDLSGREIFVKQFPELVQITLNTDAWNNGVYLLSIHSKGIILQTTKLVIN